MTSRIAALAVLSCLPALENPTRAATREWDLQALLSQGYDSNPLELNEGASGGGLTQVGLGSRLNVEWSRRGGFYLSGDARRNFHDSDLSGADATRGAVEAGIGLVLLERGDQRLSAALRGSYAVDRTTFIDPATGEIYLVDADPNASVPIPDRFDVNTTAAMVDLRFRVSRSFMLMLDSRLEREDFVDDYEDVPTLEPLDARALSVRPGARWQIGNRVRLDLSAEWGRRRYDALSAIDEEAAAVSDSRRAYRYTGVRTALRLDPSKRLSLAIGIGGTDRKDLHASYYDAVGMSSFVTVGWTPVEKTRVRAYVSQASYAYDRATLDNDPEGALRGGDSLRGLISAERDAAERVTFFVQAGAARSDNKDSLFAYRRSWAEAGLRVRR